jgi:zinc protease
MEIEQASEVLVPKSRNSFVRRVAGLALTVAVGGALGVAAPIGAAPARASEKSGVFFPETFTLANGMQVVVVANKRAPVVLHMVWYKVGAADEPPGKSGIAHFLEHLMFKGTKTLKPGQFSRIVAANGGQENAITSHDFTAYFQSVAKDRLETVMRIEADRMSNLVLTDAEVERERLVVLEERRSRTENQPRSLLWEQTNAALHIHHPYRIPVIGWEHEIKGLTTADAMAFYRRWYAPNNAILVVAGDVTAAEVRPLAEKYYGAIAAKSLPERARPLDPPHRHARRVVYRDARVDQPAWTRHHIAPSYNRGESKHAYALQVLSEIIGGGGTSRFYQELVVKQKIATNIATGYSATHYDLSTFNIYASPYTGIDLDRLEKAIDAEIAKLVEGGVSEDEVKRAKQVMTDRAAFARDNLRTGAMSFGAALTAGRSIADVEAWTERIAAVTVEEINAAARHVLKDTGSVTGNLIGTGAREPKKPGAAVPGGFRPAEPPSAD